LSGIKTENEEIPFFLRSDFRQRYLTQTLEDGLKITDGNGARQDTFWWRNFIGLSTVSARGEMTLETDEMLFNNIFAIGLQELQKLSVLNSTEASRQLYDLSTGVSRYSIAQILGNLARNRERFLASDTVPEMLKTEDLEWCDDLATPVFLREIAGRNTRRSKELGTLLNYRQILEKQLENIQAQNKQYGKIHAERTALAERIRRLTEEIQQQKHKIRILEIAEQIQEEWRERSELDDAIIDFGKENPELADFTEQKTENLRENLKRVRTLKEEIRKLGESRDALREKLGKLLEERGKNEYQDELIQILPSFESLFQQQEWIENLRGRLEDLYRQQLDSEAQLAIDYRRIGLEMPTLEEGKTVPENIFPFSIRALRPLRTPSREMGRVRKQIQTVRKKRAQLLREAEENTLKLGVYYRACKERCTGNAKIQELPGMENFPEAFLMQDADGTGKRRESTPKETLKEEERNREKTTQNVLNSRVVNEIPEGILTQNGTWENAERQNTLMDVNAASRLLGEVLATERRAEIHLQQLMQTLENIEKSKREEKETARKLTLSDSELFLIGGLFTLGLTLFLFTTLCMMGVLAPWGVAHVLFFLLGIVLAGGCVAWRVVQVRKIQKKLSGFQESLPSLEQQKNRLIRLYFTERETETKRKSERETEIISLPYTELMTLCKREEEKGRERVTFLEAELKDAENACTLVAKRSALLLEARHLAERLRKLKGSYEDAKKRRAEMLRSLKLPENWSSANIRQLIDASDRIRELWRRRGRDLEDFRLYAQELDLLVKRLEKLLTVFGEDFTRSVRGGDARFPYVGNVFALMEARLDEEKARKQSAENLERKAEEIRTEERKLKADFRKKTHACRQILERSGVENGNKLGE
ncbi:MAG: hypothetical protein Q4C70_05360, partial [Planctomycetia bacterium]|nr:hypothetical protein [Planctomycetia bacterium]